MRRIFTILALATLSAVTLEASILEVEPFDRSGRTLQLRASGASMHAFVLVVEKKSGVRIEVDFADFRFDSRKRGLTPLELLVEVAEDEGLELFVTRTGLLLSDRGERRVSLDVSGVAAEVIVTRVARECGFRNVWIPEQLGTRGTFRFEDVGCSVALSTILSSLDLEAEGSGNGVLVVRRGR